MTKDEILKMSLDAMEGADMIDCDMHDAITAIKEALAQPEQEPVAFVKGCNRGQWEIFPAKAYQIFENEQPLYTTPRQRTWVGLEEKDMPVDPDPMYDHKYFIAGMVYADKILKEKNT
jgi:hypothetical protein